MQTNRTRRAWTLAPRPLVLAMTVALAAALVLIAAPDAGAGTFRAVQCSPITGGGPGDATFRANSQRYEGTAECGGPGLGVRHRAGRRQTAAKRFGAWTLEAPAGAEIIRATARAKGRAESGHRPDLVIGLASGATKTLAGLGTALRALTWAGTTGRYLSARLTCARTRCGAGERAHVRMRRVSLTMRDSIPPSIEPGGELLAGGSRRGVQGLDIAAQDRGSGVRALSVEVNGDPLTSRSLACALSGRVAIRLQPCPANPARRLEIATRSPEFRQGPNSVRICASDYGARHNANRTCETRSVRIDRLCPISGIAGAELRARFEGGGTQVRTSSADPTHVTGSVHGADGSPLAGARVCVAARALGTGHPEKVVATPITDPQGRFRARIPAGPSREVRVAHWPDAEGALERYLKIEARAIPRLNLSPDRVLRNGEHVRFRVRIPGPARAGRRVEVKAKSGRRWVQVASGRTNRSGVWRGAYRFRSTTGTRRYRFRAHVPRQAGYPFAPGYSKTRRATVKG